jgi:hypothetical protein
MDAATSGRRCSRHPCRGLQVLLDAETSALTAETGLLDPAEGRRSRGPDPAVEADHPDLELLADGERTVDVGG